jgi:hypothetical protein
MNGGLNGNNNNNNNNNPDTRSIIYSWYVIDSNAKK